MTWLTPLVSFELLTVYTVHCTLYTVQCTVQYTVYIANTGSRPLKGVTVSMQDSKVEFTTEMGNVADMGDK